MVSTIPRHLEPLETNEIQICTEGLRFSSFSINNDGLPFLSPNAERVLRQSLEYKRAFDELWVAMNEPAPEIVPQTKAVVGISPIKQPPSASSEALEEHTAGASVEPEKPVPAAECSSPSVTTPVIAPILADCVPAAVREGQKGLSDTHNRNEALEAIDSKGLTEPFLGKECGDVYSPTNEPADVSGSFSPLSVARRRRAVLLTEDERAAAVALGITKAKPVRAIAASVLDDYKRVNRTGRQSATLSKNVLIKKVVEQGNRCIYCNRKFGAAVYIDGECVRLRAEPDHVSPRAERLNNSQNNIVAACHICNQLKSSRKFDGLEEIASVLRAAWEERGWKDVPLLVPYKLTSPDERSWKN